MTETWTFQKILTWCAGFFKDRGIESARLDAEVLLGHVLGLPRLQLYVQFDRPLAQNELAAFKELVKRRARLEPTAYITGKKDFWSREFEVTPAVLIPRPDTETLIEEILKKLKDRTEDLHGFEVGLGSGCIAITLLAELPNLKMTAVEVSREAIQVAKKNAAVHGVTDRLTILEADFLSTDFPGLVSSATPFDFIASNPPYISEAEFPELPESVRGFEPRHALIAKDGGLAFYKKLVEFTEKNVKPRGFTAVEIGDTQGQAVSELFGAAGLSEIGVVKDYARLDRVVTGYHR